ncbi:hypothetical protein PPTG_21776 [Phytophthora nicotianae INRA-310]|uniref:Uncharacterized protein n=1 Tax=Phytophthora nicotianae (strain INRA-310) TaxID=761204 RepID=W2QU70_PHYN3|nr:hypothetical protein PPTG_21776 [Phytophthora nicotianae INRA-310]ETN16747.1 hypothetical protein PPTG_21776 [Phytophthora nicotianae INRA-310]
MLKKVKKEWEEFANQADVTSYEQSLTSWVWDVGQRGYCKVGFEQITHGVCGAVWKRNDHFREHFGRAVSGVAH